MSPGTSTTQGRRPRPGALARHRAARHLADTPGRRHARITTRPATRTPARTRRTRGGGTRRNRHGRCRVPAPARPSPAARRAPAVTGPGSGPPVPHPRFRAALRRGGGGARPAGRRSPAWAPARAAPALAAPTVRHVHPGQAHQTRQMRRAGPGATGRTGLARPARLASLSSRLAGPVRPGAGGDAGRVPAAAAAGAVDNRAGPRPHPAARAPALGRAAAAGPAGGDLPSHRRRHGDGRGRGLRAACPRAGPPAGTGRRAGDRGPGGPSRAGGCVSPSRRPRRRPPRDSGRRPKGPAWAPGRAAPASGSAAQPAGSAGGAVTRVAVAQLVLAPRAAGAGGVAADLAELPAAATRCCAGPAPRRPRSVRCRTAGRAAAAG